ncbi:coiled-coil domain-containing protein [Streptomyces sasae]|uniref:hypothetical protein n=1 Tax=Streptomyces sasae TaxID=1266772 RepID=UPI00292F2048|nr:hypothetical protein [Streptomyces sasae]
MAHLLRTWMDAANLTFDDLATHLTAEHFRDGRVPGRSTIGERLAGVKLEDDFVEAVADVCSRDVAERDRMLLEARALRAMLLSPPPGTEPLPLRSVREEAELTAELVQVQRRSIEVQDKLLRALERAAELERERGSANRMVMVLLHMVDKLHRDIATLNAERDRLRIQARRPDLLAKVRERLARSEIQRKRAEDELQRAQAERCRADRLAEEAVEQIKALTEELERLRSGGQPDNLSLHRGPVLRSEAWDEAADTDADDIDAALNKAARHLDDGAERLERLAQDLHQDHPPGSHGALVTQASPVQDEGSDAQAVDERIENLTREVLVLFRRIRQQPSRLEAVALNDPIFVVEAMGVLLKSEEDNELVFELLGIVAAQGTASHVAAVAARLNDKGRSDYVYHLLIRVAQGRPAEDIAAIVDMLRVVGLDESAYRLLTAVGRFHPVSAMASVVRTLAGIKPPDARWVLRAVEAERQEEVGLVLLALDREQDSEDLLRYWPRSRRAGALPPAGYWSEDTLELGLPWAEPRAWHEAVSWR